MLIIKKMWAQFGKKKAADYENKCSIRQKSVFLVKFQNWDILGAFCSLCTLF